MESTYSRLVDTVKASLDRLISKAPAMGFDEAAASVDVYEQVMVKFANNEVTVIQSWTGVDATVYLAREGRVYVVERQLTSVEAVDRLLKDAEKVLAVAEKAKPYAPLPEPTGKPLDGLVDATLEAKMDSLAEVAEAIINAGLEVNGRAKLAGMVDASKGLRIVYTSKGARLEEPYTSIETYARAVMDNGSGHWAYTSTRYSARDVEEVGRRAVEYAVEASSKPSMKPEPGVYQAILSPLVVGNLVGDIAWMASGLAVLMGFSVFAKHGIGSRIGSEQVTVIDDPHDKLLPGSTGFDDEGIATRPKRIIGRGVVESLLHNTKTASAMGVESTGNAGYIMPRPWNVVVSPGDASYEEMVAEVKRGFIVLNNWYTRFQNYYEGVFSTVTRDALLYVENGEIKGSVERLRIADTVASMLSNTRLVGRELYSIKWWEIPFPTKAPYMLIDRLRFTVAEG